MKRLLIALVVVAVLAGVALFATPGTTMEVVNERTAATSTPEVIVETDIIAEAKKELERINLELDAEETKILEEQAQYQAEYKARDAEYETRLETIRETRTSFR